MKTLETIKNALLSDNPIYKLWANDRDSIYFDVPADLKHVGIHGTQGSKEYVFKHGNCIHLKNSNLDTLIKKILNADWIEITK